MSGDIQSFLADIQAERRDPSNAISQQWAELARQVADPDSPLRRWLLELQNDVMARQRLDALPTFWAEAAEQAAIERDWGWLFGLEQAAREKDYGI